jgi:hypothetical protein
MGITDGALCKLISPSFEVTEGGERWLRITRPRVSIPGLDHFSQRSTLPSIYSKVPYTHVYVPHIPPVLYPAFPVTKVGSFMLLISKRRDDATRA